MAQVSKYRYLLNQYPETVQKEQFRIICHISKRTARYLLQSGGSLRTEWEKAPELHH